MMMLALVPFAVLLLAGCVLGEEDAPPVGKKKGAGSPNSNGAADTFFSAGPLDPSTSDQYRRAMARATLSSRIMAGGRSFHGVGATTTSTPAGLCVLSSGRESRSVSERRVRGPSQSVSTLNEVTTAVVNRSICSRWPG